ncbi:MAG TPA: DNA polymerase III subunit, partial [Anaerolineales bacterium]|nr:DNA polymerase III subunit [Anaerolineales bacterium]
MNWEIIGHDWAVSALREHVASGQQRHAYLFTGPRGVGRRTLALRFAQALNCTQPLAPGEPCGTCRACTRIEKMQHPDLAVVQAEEEGGTLKVDQVRELGRSLALAPYEARYRLALLLRFEEAHISAANALLKTLEEPAERVILLVTAESSEALLPTIVSRCEVLRLRPVPYEILSAGLQRRLGLPAERARLLAQLSGGRPGYALRLHGSPEMLHRREQSLVDHFNLLNSNLVQRFDYAEKLARDKAALVDVLQTWLSLWRDVLLKAAGASTPPVNADQREAIANLAGQFGLET